ncbi:hypothetical protein Q4Q34_01215 [Flavivirga abyssicola]|uniref:hypothetical protein n=1 Tax=Flavivirga abyssicola TaxID=3063533 RepID=UPI0026E0FB1C|nr:hypothetical protein [Flavivirga sp. MEBiC07777]WVK13658.1 hypothetical protein Q4Q34_01215 [Flavivirga sp. MEBiC07777]
MNKLLTLFLLFSLNAFSQFKLMDKKLEEKSFQSLNRPSTENKLSNFLKQRIHPDELISLDYSTNPNLDNSIRAQFEVDQMGKPWNFRIYTGKRDLNKKLEKLLKEFLLEEVPNLSDLHQAKNKIQLLSKEGDKSIINASSVIVSDYPPVFDNYQDNSTLSTQKEANKKKLNADSSISDVFERFPISGDCQNIAFNDAYDCFKTYLENFIINNLNNDLLKKEEIIGELKTNIHFKIDKKGQLKDLKCYSYNETIEKEIIRILNLFAAKIIKPARRNGIAFESAVNRIVLLYIVEDLTKTKISNLENNLFTKHFRQELSTKNINSANLTPRRPVIKLLFSFNKKGNLSNIETNTKNEKLSKSIIRAFKKFPLDLINLDKSIDRIYSLNIIRNVTDKKQVLCDNEFQWISVGNFKQCYKCKDIDNIKEFNIDQIQNYIVNKFNSKNDSYKLTKSSGLPKPPFINLQAYISQEGTLQINNMVKTEKISTTNTKDPILSQIKSIIEQMPKYLKPPLKNGKPHRFEMGYIPFELIKH